MDQQVEKQKSNEISIDFRDIDVSIDDFSDSVTDTFKTAANIGSAVNAGMKTVDLQSAINNFASEMNKFAIAKSTGQPVKSPTYTFKGFAAEEYFKHTLKINSLAQGIPDYKLGICSKGTMPDGTVLSGTDEKVDIVTWIAKKAWSNPERQQDFQVKIYNKPNKYTKFDANSKYDGTTRIGTRDNGIVADRIDATVGNKTVYSDTISNEEAEILADQMKAQSTAEYKHGAEKQAELNKVNLGNAMLVGAATGAILSTVKEIVDVIKNRHNLPEDQFVKSIEHILCGTVDGTVRSGAIVGSVQLLGKVIGKEIAANSLEAVPIMAIANTAVDFAKDLYRCFVTQTIDTDDLLCNSINNAFTSAAGFAGGYAGGQLGGLVVGTFASAKSAAATGAAIGSALGPIGTVVGSVVGGVVIGIGANLIVGTANKDAQQAFNDCIADLNSHIELSGFDKLYYFADSMSSISEFKLSFKNLLPCYNLISDLKEYNLRKKAINNIHAQLNDSLSALEESKNEALLKLEEQHLARITELTRQFNDQRENMFDSFRDSINVYVSNSYSQYLGLYDIMSGNIDSLSLTMETNIASYNAILESTKNRVECNKELNHTLAEIMVDDDSAKLLRPFIDKLTWYMQQDELLVGKQYISWQDAMNLTKEVIV